MKWTRTAVSHSKQRVVYKKTKRRPGNSGSPVLREKDSVSIGVHVYGGAPNSASVIGLYGNPFLDYVAAFDLYEQKFGNSGRNSASGVEYIAVPTSKTPNIVENTVNLNDGTFGTFTREYGFTGVKNP